MPSECRPASYEPRKALYAKFLETFRKGVRLAGENCERVEIPYENSHIAGQIAGQIAGLYVRAEGVTGRAPILVQINGLDSTKEMIYRVGGLKPWPGAGFPLWSLTSQAPARHCACTT